MLHQYIQLLTEFSDVMAWAAPAMLPYNLSSILQLFPHSHKDMASSNFGDMGQWEQPLLGCLQLSLILHFPGRATAAQL